ncbi:related to KRE27 - member of a transmembrane complex required for efficient folding of proteins in the ER [Ustilago bromivora]|uniref:Trafficking protein particle complex subunit 2-like protein n=1 Tax=Ustilago bromivora TaxID=307758 RepID=A0A8H8QM51_9BASI|nr:related to KRE27 - member of a transmembrane complex required for efficient folding of proteins in the ER [Ustilago bromivora]
MSASAPRIQALAIISPRSGPIYVRQFGKSPSDPTAADLRYHYFAHSALDVMDERISSQTRTTEQYLGLLYTLEDLAVYGFQTCTRLRFLLMLQLSDHAVRDIDMLTLFRAVHTVYLRWSADPFHSLPPSNFAGKEEEGETGPEREQKELEQRQGMNVPVNCRQIKSAAFDAKIERIVFGSSKTAAGAPRGTTNAAPVVAVVFFHAAYSTYEHLSLRKSLGLVGAEARAMPVDITLETLVSFIVILLGVALTAAPLKNVTWASEMRTKSVDEVDSRSSFATLTHRGQILFAPSD